MLILKNKYYHQIILFVLLGVFSVWVILYPHSINILFIIYNILIAIFLITGIKVCFKKLVPIKSEIIFTRKILVTAFAVRMLYMLHLYGVWHYFTGTPFSIEAIDALGFHRYGLSMAEMIRDGNLNFFQMWNKGIDDIGAPIIFGFIYRLTGNSVFAVRILQVILSTATVYFIYKALYYMGEIKVARISAVFLTFAGSIVFYTGVHLKETYMLFFMSGIIYSSSYLFNKEIKLKYLIYLALCFTGLITMRFILFFILFFSTVFYFLFGKTVEGKTKKKRQSLAKKVFIGVAFLFTLSLFFKQLSFFNFAVSEMSAIALKGEKQQTSGGRGVGSFEYRGVTVGEMASAPVMTLVSLSTPFPSLTRTNVYHKYGQTEQWYHIGNLIIWGFFLFFSYLGLYYLFKHKKARQYSIVLLILLLYSIALAISFYITSIRFNIPKMLPLIPIIAYGYVHCEKKFYKLWPFYMAVYCLLVFVWNYIKLSSRGMI